MNKRHLTSTFLLVALFLMSLVSSIHASTSSMLSGADRIMDWPYLVTVVTIFAVTVVAAAWCLIRGTTIGASAVAERPEVSSWGLTLNVMGALIIVYGLVMSLLILLPDMLSFLVLLIGGIPIVALALIAYTSWHMRATVRDGKNFSYITYVAIASIIIVLVSSISIWMSGGVIVIPETAWPLLIGALTMVGAGFCAAICIITAVNAGAKAMADKPELSIWSLLFVALGEGLAIYGLIVAILIIMR